MIEPDSSTRVSRNFWKIFALKFLGEFLPIAPVLILFYTANGLNSTQIFTIQAAFHLAVLLLEVPSGYLADVVGRRKTLVIGAIFFPLGLAVYAAGRSFAAFVLAEVILAVSVSMRSGCDSAMLFDSLRQLGRQGEYKRFEGKCALVARSGTAVSSLAGGLLADDLPAPAFPGQCRQRPVHAAGCAGAGRAGAREAPLQESAARYPAHLPLLPAAAPYPAGDPLLRAAHGLPADRRFGPIFSSTGNWASAWAGSASCSPFSSWPAPWADRARTLLPSVSGPGPPCTWRCSARSSIVLLGLLPSPWLLPLIPANALLWNLAYPVLLERLNLAVGSDVRATVLSLAGMAGSVTFIVVSPLFGRLVDAVSLSAAFIALGAFFLAAGAPLLTAMLRNWQEAVTTHERQ